MSEENSVIESYRAKLNSEIEKVERYVLAGKCVDHAEYLARISEIHAYKRAKDDFQLTLQEYFEEKDEDNLQPSEEEEFEDE
jgi:hypothetical protein